MFTYLFSDQVVTPEDQTFGAAPQINASGDQTQLPPGVPEPPPSPPIRTGLKRLIPTSFGLLFLLIAAGVGVYLIQQQGIGEIRERAGESECHSPNLEGCTFVQNPTHCWRATTTNACSLPDGSAGNTQEIYSGPAVFEGLICYTCDTNSGEAGARKCSVGTLVETNPACQTLTQ